jgi:hypothetical protein
LGFECLHVRTGTFEIPLEQLCASSLLTRSDGSVVDTPIPDHVLEEIGGLFGAAALGGHTAILGSKIRHTVRRRSGSVTWACSKTAWSDG